MPDARTAMAEVAAARTKTIACSLLNMTGFCLDGCLDRLLRIGTVFGGNAEMLDARVGRGFVE